MALVGSLLKKGIHFSNIVANRRKASLHQQQKKTLAKLLAKARYTEFGEKYNFDELLSSILFGDKGAFYEEYKKNVPIYDYNKIFNEWWHKSLEGEKDVCWPGQIKYYALSSGTSEAASKHIPVTKAMSRAIQKTSIRQILSLGHYKDLPPDLYEKGFLMLSGSTNLKDQDKHFEGDLSGIQIAQIPYWFRPYYKPGQKIAAQQDWGLKLEEITKIAKEWDIGFIVGVPAWIQLLMEKIIAYYNVKTIHDIWPNLQVFAHGGVSFEPYRKGFEKLLGRPLYYINTYLASEGFIAYQTRPNAPGMDLVCDNGIFFEFIPFNEKNFDSDGTLLAHPETLMIDQVEEGKEYALLLSTCAGAWRYLIGDTVKFVDKSRGEIQITGRTKHYLSLCGEHLSVDNMNRAIDLVADEMSLSVKEFTVSGIEYGTMFAHHWYIGVEEKNVDTELLKKKLDAKLAELNDDYAVERRHALQEVFVTILPNEAFYAWMKSKGKLGGQNKFPRVFKSYLHDDWNNFLKTEGYITE
ncbi:GH3 family domain-containing protein [Dyadobacter luticola]|uniref:GH3 auxin-responsive promoter family protein n=1 Tax=Dyadobacter luticola TaxID=1979387 RepID=A0A5R9L3I0_9BACT|nr:GH3 auxin-responsive promoter family protein [Dyadobacter luticola]TLV02820.1 GH3 auxin-responsive promoter family protein [Dyadobacter luticola]